MHHLSPGELIDLAEGAPRGAAASHLAACASCRRQLADLDAALNAAADVEVPEPSPLFWDHLAARVREAVASEAAPRRRSWLDAGRWVRPVSAGALAAVVLAVAHTVGHRSTTPPAALSGLADIGMLADDPSLDLVADLTAEVEWDATADAPLTPHDGSVDRVVTQLTEGERRELQRLLEQELRQSGD